MADYIHGGTDLREVARLIKQALAWVASRMLGARALPHLPGAEFHFSPLAALASR